MPTAFFGDILNKQDNLKKYFLEYSDIMPSS